MKIKIRGTILPIVDVELSQGEAVFAESGGMSWMTPNISMDTNLKGGLGKMFGRMLTGESLFMVTYQAQQGKGMISFCSEFPGKVVPIDLQAGESIICQRDAFMMAQDGVELKMEFVKRFGAGMFGGEGFFLQKITGPGKAFLEFPGEMTEYTLQEGQVLKVDPGYLGAFEPSVSYDITRIKGVRNMLFSGEGIFLATLKGPGKVYLQSMPLRNLAMKLLTHMPAKRR